MLTNSGFVREQGASGFPLSRFSKQYGADEKELKWQNTTIRFRQSIFIF